MPKRLLQTFAKGTHLVIIYYFLDYILRFRSPKRITSFWQEEQAYVLHCLL
jgi:hypothetical protein